MSIAAATATATSTSTATATGAGAPAAHNDHSWWSIWHRRHRGLRRDILNWRDCGLGRYILNWRSCGLGGYKLNLRGLPCSNGLKGGLSDLRGWIATGGT